MVFGHAGSVYRISKTFLDSPKSLLERKRADGVFEAIAKGKTADEQVRTLLRTAGGRSKEKSGERLGLLSVLCSAQGGQELPALSGDALADIRGMLGAQVSGAQGIAFERAVDKKYLSVWTPSGKAKTGKLTTIQDALVRARSDAQQCSAALQRAVDSEASARAKRALHQEKLDELGVAQAEYRPIADTAQEVLDCAREERRQSAVWKQRRPDTTSCAPRSTGFTARQRRSAAARRPGRGSRNR